MSVCKNLGRQPGGRRGAILASHGECNYNVIMKSTLVAIGNSRGVRIPKAFLEQTGMQDEVEMDVSGSQIVIRAANHPRAGWAGQFAKLAPSGNDASPDEYIPSEWDQSEWEW